MMNTPLLAVAMLLVIAHPGSAAAPFPCDSVLLNQTGELNEALVMDATRKLEDTGAALP